MNFLEIKDKYKAGTMSDTIFDPALLSNYDEPKTLNHALSIPSTSNSYAQAIQFARDWFLSKFDKNIFKSIYIDGRYVLEDQRSLEKTKNIVRDKPALAIIPNINWDFDNDSVDNHQYGISLHRRRTELEDSFFKDKQNNSFMALELEVLQLSFTYKIKVETRAQQMELYKYIRMAHCVGNSTGEKVDLDFHVPYALIIQLAYDAGFDVETRSNPNYPKIVNITNFLSYLNTHSSLPFVYKYRGINGKNEFFLRLRDIYIHIRSIEISADDGDRDGHLMNNFGIELSVEIRFPSPKYYSYFYQKSHDNYIYGTLNNSPGIVTSIYTFKGVPIPAHNKYGWTKLLDTTYEDTSYKENKKLTIDFFELFKDSDLGDTIEYTLKQGISPSIFIDLYLVNAGKLIGGTIDWDSYKYTSYYPVTATCTYIAIYVDKEYINQYIVLNNNANKNRLQIKK